MKRKKTENAHFSKIIGFVILSFIGISIPAFGGNVIIRNGGLNVSNSFYVNPSTGNVGIGVANPLSLLHIFQSGSNTLLNASNGIVNAGLYAGALLGGQSGASIGTNSNHQFRLFTNGADRLTVDMNGNVGIGTASPGAKLDVNGDVKASTIALKGTTPSASYPLYLETGNTGAFFRLVDTNAGGGSIQMNSGGPGTPSTLYINDPDGVLINQQNPGYLAFATTNAERVRIDSSGNVGIGTASPGFTLDVVAAGGNAGIQSSGANPAFLYIRSGAGQQAGIAFGDTSPANIWTMGKQSDNTFGLRSGGGAGTQVLAVTGGGNVGIGTASPGAKLDVVGNVKIADGTQGAGKVLTSDANGVASWQAVSSGVPSGAVMFFNLASCPAGWTELTSARGRYVVGLPASGTLAGTDGTALTNLEDRPVGQHTHSISPPPTVTDSQGSHTHSITDPGHTHVAGAQSGGGGPYVCPNWYCWGTTMPTGSSTTGISINSGGAHTHTVSIAPFTSGSTGSVAGTNAPYIQLLVCQKS